MREGNPLVAGLGNSREREQALGEMLRVLRPGGRLAVLDFRHW